MNTDSPFRSLNTALGALESVSPEGSISHWLSPVLLWSSQLYIKRLSPYHPKGPYLSNLIKQSYYEEANCQGWACILFKRVQHSCILLHSFQKNATFSCSFAFFSKEQNILALFCILYKKNTAFFYVLYKRTLHSLRSFTFFIKERGVLCVLLRSL